jgi:uncharacterized RDD family membrane protein YckC
MLFFLKFKKHYLFQPILVRRLKAFAVDYIIITVYAAVLFLTTKLVSLASGLNLQNTRVVALHLISFLTLTLPVILYFAFYEHSKRGGTVGKRKYNLQVAAYCAHNITKPGFIQLLVRNTIKFLPWVLAHFFVIELIQNAELKRQTPTWIFTGLIGSQLLALVYFICLVVSKQNRSIYEVISKTRVINAS